MMGMEDLASGHFGLISAVTTKRVLPTCSTSEQMPMSTPDTQGWGADMGTVPP